MSLDEAFIKLSSRPGNVIKGTIQGVFARFSNSEMLLVTHPLPALFPGAGYLMRITVLITARPGVSLNGGGSLSFENPALPSMKAFGNQRDPGSSVV